MNDKPDLFIVTSAISTKIGSIDSNTRFLQTLATINSIIVQNPKSVIVVLDGSIETVEQYMIDEIQHRAVFISYAKDLSILNIHDQSMLYAEKCANNYSYKNIKSVDEVIHTIAAGYIKNASESYLLLNFLDKINTTDFSRIFKISGRYVLGSNFDRALHAGKITTKRSIKTNQLMEIVKCDQLVNCILWSFNPANVEEIKLNLKKAADWINASFADGIPGPDLEHGIYRFFEDRVEIENLGVLGAVNIPLGTSKFLRV